MLGEAIAATVAAHEPAAVRIAAPELGAVAACRRRVARSRPAVRDRPQGQAEGTRHRQPHLEGPYFELRRRVCLVEDVVTAGGTALEAVEALREAGLQVVQTVVCVVDREEGGADALARAAVRLRPLLLASESCWRRRKAPQNRMVERYPAPGC